MGKVELRDDGGKISVFLCLFLLFVIEQQRYSNGPLQPGQVEGIHEVSVWSILRR